MQTILDQRRKGWVLDRRQKQEDLFWEDQRTKRIQSDEEWFSLPLLSWDQHWHQIVDLVWNKEENIPEGTVYQCTLMYIKVVMNNFVLNNIELDIFTPSPADYSISLFKNFHGKVSSALVFTRNLTKE